MAYKNIVINSPGPSSQNQAKTSHFYKGFSSVDPTNAGTRLYDFSLVKQDILNHFRTRKGERVMNPAFGSIIWDLLMEPLTDEVRRALEEDINTICTFDSRVYPTQMDIIEYDSGFLIEITLVLKGTDQTEKMKLAFDQQLGLVQQ